MSQPPPPPTGNYPQQPMYLPPKKKGKTLWIILGVVGASMILCCGGIGALFAGSSSDSNDKGSQSHSTASPTNVQPGGGADKPSDATSPAAKGAITWGNWQVVGKIQVTNEQYTNDFSVILRAQNTSDSPDEGFFTVTILKGQSVLGTATCSTSTVQPGAIGTANCGSLDKYRAGWTSVTIEDAF